jgi:lysophospholipase L1-like esterase
MQATPRGYYLALGDSMAYGIQPTKVKPGARPGDFDTGYVDVFAARLRKLTPGLRVVNYGCQASRP